MTKPEGVLCTKPEGVLCTKPEGVLCTKESCLKPEALRKAGYQSVKEWMETLGNVYTGNSGGQYCVDKSVNKWYTFEASKWKNPFAPIPDVKTSMLLYVKYLFRSGLIYDIEELRGKNLGCFCHEPREVWSEPKCNNQVLVDILNRCYEIIEETIKNKNAEKLPHVDHPKSVITLTNISEYVEDEKEFQQD